MKYYLDKSILIVADESNIIHFKGSIYSVEMSKCTPVFGENLLNTIEGVNEKDFDYYLFKLILEEAKNTQYVIQYENSNRVSVYPLPKKFNKSIKRILKGVADYRDLETIIDSLKPFFKESKNFKKFKRMLDALIIRKIYSTEDRFPSDKVSFQKHFLITPYNRHTIITSTLTDNYEVKISIKEFVNRLKEFGVKEINLGYAIVDYAGHTAPTIQIPDLDIYLFLDWVIDNVPDFIDIVENQGIKIDKDIRKEILNYLETKRRKLLNKEIKESNAYEILLDPSKPCIIKIPDDDNWNKIAVSILFGSKEIFTDKEKAAEFISENGFIAKYKDKVFFDGKVIKDRKEILDVLSRIVCS